VNSNERAALVRQIAERLAEAIAERDERKAKLATDQFALLCEQVATAEAKPDPELVLRPTEEEACWDQIAGLARTLDDAVNVCDLSMEINASAYVLEEIGKQKAQTPEVVARLEEIETVRFRLQSFVDAARQYIADVENLYGCSLADIQRCRCERGGA
jgi:hypothetical protein